MPCAQCLPDTNPLAPKLRGLLAARKRHHAHALAAPAGLDRTQNGSLPAPIQTVPPVPAPGSTYGWCGGASLCPLADEALCTDTAVIVCRSPNDTCTRQDQWYWEVRLQPCLLPCAFMLLPCALMPPADNQNADPLIPSNTYSSSTCCSVAVPAGGQRNRCAHQCRHAKRAAASSWPGTHARALRAAPPARARSRAAVEPLRRQGQRVPAGQQEALPRCCLL